MQFCMLTTDYASVTFTKQFRSSRSSEDPDTTLPSYCCIPTGVSHSTEKRGLCGSCARQRLLTKKYGEAAQ